LLVSSSSGLIIAFVVVVWAAYFIPLALRRYDEASKNASVETAGGLSRVIARTTRKPAPADRTMTDQTPTDQTPMDHTPMDQSRAQAAATSPAPRARTADRPAARRAARRRRRTLLTLLALTAIVGGLAGFGVIAPYFVAGPAALVVAWLVACRVQVRRERGVVRSAPVRREDVRDSAVGDEQPRASRLVKIRTKLAAVKLPAPRLSAAKPARSAPAKAKAKAKAKAADEEDTVIVSGQFEDIDPGRKHEMESVPLEVDALDDQVVIAVPSISTAGEALWDPLPVTLPTYVTKPRAGRTVRTIDFSQPHTWTSGHIEGEDVVLPKRDDDTGEQRRAVGH
jgi:hypothetical protein